MIKIKEVKLSKQIKRTRLIKYIIYNFSLNLGQFKNLWWFELKG